VNRQTSRNNAMRFFGRSLAGVIMSALFQVGRVLFGRTEFQRMGVVGRVGVF
jgi:hypothetical protein